MIVTDAEHELTEFTSERAVVDTVRTPDRAKEITRFIRANGSSILATLVEWGLVKVLVSAGVHYLIAAGAGALLGAVMDFSLKRHWAFVRGQQMGTVHGEAFRYLVASALSLVWNLLVSYLLVSVAGLPAVSGVILASIIVGLAWNYPVHRLYVFHDRHPVA